MRKKRLPLMIIATAIIISIIYSCKKEGLFSLSGGKNGARGMSGCTVGVDVICGDVLHFTSEDQFDSIYDCLNAEYESYNATWEATYSTLDDTTYNQLCDSLNFEDEQPLIDFESSFSYSSARAYLDILEREWLNVHNMDSVHDPDHFDMWYDEVEATLYNRYGEVSIGDSVYHMLPNGDILIIHNSDCKNLKNIRIDPEHWYEYGATLRQANAGGTDICSKYEKERHWIFKDYYQYIKNDRLRIQSVLHTPRLHKSTFCARTTYFKKMKSNKFKKQRMHMQTWVNLRVFDSGCLGALTHSNPDDNSGRRKSVRARVKENYTAWTINDTTYSKHYGQFSPPDRDTLMYLHW